MLSNHIDQSGDIPLDDLVEGTSKVTGLEHTSKTLLGYMEMGRDNRRGDTKSCELWPFYSLAMLNVSAYLPLLLPAVGPII